jgi:hypothetical protein
MDGGPDLADADQAAVGTADIGAIGSSLGSSSSSPFAENQPSRVSVVPHGGGAYSDKPLPCSQAW